MLGKKKKENPAAAPAAVLVPAAGARLANALAALYTAAFTAELAAGSYQLETGAARFWDEELPPCGGYDALLDALKRHVVPEQADALLTVFDRRTLLARFLGGGTSVSGIYCFGGLPNPAAPPEAQPRWMRLEALLLGAEAGGAVRCLLLARPVNGADDDGRTLTVAPTPGNLPILRAQKLMGGLRTHFFEYDPACDEMTLHLDLADPARDRRIARYLGGITLRRDWTLFHEDIPAVHKLLQSGRSGAVEIRYRAAGDYRAPFRWHRFQCAPLSALGGGDGLLLGAITDIENEVALRNANRDTTLQIGMLVQSSFTRIYEIDTVRGTLGRITHADGNYTRDSAPRPMAELIEAEIAGGVIHPDSAPEYRNWLLPGFLERCAGSGRTYAFESGLRLPGNTDYRWYAESITCPDPGTPHRFLRLCRDITELHRQREHNLRLQERARYAEYSEAMLDALADVVEFRSMESGQHIRRVREVTMILLNDLANREPRYQMTPAQIQQAGEAATMHDVGKIAVPDAVLNKPGKLTDEEFAIMRSHTLRGAQIIDRLHLDHNEALKARCRDVALHHHERWDGTGYPDGLAGDANSITAQVVGLADAYDALVSERCYKLALSHEEALAMLQSGQCGAFNPSLLASLLACGTQIDRKYHPNGGFGAPEP